MKKKALLEWKSSIPVKKQKDKKYFGNLKWEVIDAGICSHCGTCVAICPVYGIVYEDKPIHFPNWEKECIDDGACVKYCPRVDYEPLSGLGEYTEIVAAKSSRFGGQDGGMVTEIFATALDSKIIDTAVVVGRDNKWKPQTKVARNAKALEDDKVKGTKYSFAGAIPDLRDALKAAKKPGVVGTPCMTSGHRNLQKNVKLFSKIELVISTFCMENFYYHKLAKFLKGKEIDDLSKVTKMDITKGKFIATLDDGSEVKFPIKEMDDIVPSGCMVCQDFTGVESDISVGSVGSDDGYSTVIVRTEKGKEVMDAIRESGNAEFAEVDTGPIQKNVDLKVKKHPYPPPEEEEG